MKILIIHQYYLLPGRPGGSRFNEMARFWAEAGHDVTVIAGSLDYTTGEIATEHRGHWTTREMDGRVKVWRCCVPATYASGYAGRAWAFVAFMLSSATAVMRAQRPDVVLATSPPLLTTVPGWLASRRHLKRVPWVFEIRDLWPESAVTTGVLRSGSIVTRLLYRLERWACRRADAIVTLTPAFTEDLVKRKLAARGMITCIPNGADLELFGSEHSGQELRKELGWDGRTVALYAGAHGRANAIGQLVEAAERLSSRPDVLIATVGDGPERARWEEETRARGVKNLVFLGPQPKERMPQIVQAADIGLAVLQKNETFKTVYPNKVFDYMASGKPTVLAIDGIARELVCDEAGAGLFAEPENGDAIAAAILRLTDNPDESTAMGARGLAWVREHADRSALAQRYLRLLETLAVSSADTVETAAAATDRAR